MRRGGLLPTETITLYSDEFNVSTPAADDTLSDGDATNPGDPFAFYRSLWDSEDYSADPVGTQDGSGGVTEVTGGTMKSFGTFQLTLDEGNILAGGTYTGRRQDRPGDRGRDRVHDHRRTLRAIEFTITGGTGDYDGASGHITQTALEDDADELKIEVTTPG